MSDQSTVPDHVFGPEGAPPEGPSAPSSGPETPPHEVPVLDDEDFDDAHRETPLSSLEEELRGDPKAEPIVLGVPNRPGYQVRYSTDLPDELATKLAKAAKDKSVPGGVSRIGFAARVVATQCQGIIRKGDDVTSDGHPLTFRSKALLDLLEVGRAIDAVRKFYVLDGHVIAACEAISEAAGYGAELEEGEDPTKGE